MTIIAQMAGTKAAKPNTMDKFNQIINEEKAVLVDFFAMWCGPCKIMHPILEELKKKIGDNAHILKVDIDSPANRNLVSQYQVHSVPTLIIFRNGQPVWRQSGVRPVEELEKALQL